MKTKIAVMGGLNMDMIMNIDLFPRAGETLTATSFSQAPGGKGGNQAAAAAKLGASVTMVGAVGKDALGDTLLSRLTAMGVDTGAVVRVSDAPTGTALITVAKDGQNTIVFYPGANDRICEQRIEEVLQIVKESDIFLVGNECLKNFTEEAIKAAHKLNKLVIFNSAPARKLVNDVLACCDVIIANETETEVLTGKKVESQEECEKAADTLLAIGSSAVIITLGSKGAYFKENRKEQGTLVPAPKVKSIEAVGAGDIFTGAFSLKYGETKDLHSAVVYANHGAALSTTKPGIYPSIPTDDELQEFMKTRIPG